MKKAALFNLTVLTLYPQLARAHDPAGELRWGLAAVLIYALGSAAIAALTLRNKNRNPASTFKKLGIAILILAGAFVAFVIGAVAQQIF